MDKSGKHLEQVASADILTSFTTFIYLQAIQSVCTVGGNAHKHKEHMQQNMRANITTHQSYKLNNLDECGKVASV